MRGRSACADEDGARPRTLQAPRPPLFGPIPDRNGSVRSRSFEDRPRDVSRVGWCLPLLLLTWNLVERQGGQERQLAVPEGWTAWHPTGHPSCTWRLDVVGDHGGNRSRDLGHGRRTAIWVPVLEREPPSSNRKRTHDGRKPPHMAAECSDFRKSPPETYVEMNRCDGEEATSRNGG